MARTCGIRVGPRRFEIVVLDGNPKKHRIAAFKTGEFRGGDDEAARTLGEAVKELKIPLDATSIAIDTGLAAFRTLKLPFSEREKIDEVIKFEVESQLPQWDIGEVVVDFVVQDQVEGETNLLVSAVPKADLKRVLELCSQAGVEPLEADLESTAMVNAALGADICHVDDAQILVHVGEGSTSVVVVDGGKVRSMRAIHVGAFAAAEVDRSDKNEKGDKPEAQAPPAAGETPPDAEPVETAAPLDPEAEQRRLGSVVSRITRELGRTISGARTVNPISAIYVCGFSLPDLVGSTLMDVPIYELDVFEEDSGQPASAAPLVVAYGVALRQLGGPSIETSLRREELRFTGTLERVELPLAIAALLLATLAGIFCMFEFMQLKGRERDVKAWRASAENFLIGDPAKGHAGNLSQPLTDLDNYLKKYKYDEKLNLDGDPERSDWEQLQYERTLLGREVRKLESQLGTSGEVTLPQSALQAATLVLGVFDSNKEKLGRFSIRMLDATYVQGTSGRVDTVKVMLDLSFFGDTAVDATVAYDQLEPALRAQRWVVDIDKRGSKEFDEKAPTKGIFVQGFTISCDLTKVPKP